MPARLDSLTGLRFLAAFAVFGLHLLLAVPHHYSALKDLFAPGATGVSFFFILSGFVLTWSHSRRDTARAFMRRRLARIYPMHVATWAAFGVIVTALATRPPVLPALGSLSLLATWIPSRTYYLAMNQPSWSLGCEFFFYLLFPAMLRPLSAMGSSARRWLLGGIVLAVLAVAVICSPATDASLKFWALYQFPPARLLEFAAGVIVALELRAGRLPRIPFAPAALVAAGAYVAAGFAGTAFGVVAVTFVPFLLLIVAAAQADIAGRRTVMSRPVAVRLGVWSFSFYLVHGIVIMLMVKYASALEKTSAGSFAFAVLAFAISLGVAAASYHFVEHPFEALFRTPRSPRPAMRPETVPAPELS